MRPATVIGAVFAVLVSQGNIAAALPISGQQSSSNNYLDGRSATTEIRTRDVAAEIEARGFLPLDVRDALAGTDPEHHDLAERTTKDVLAVMGGALAASVAVKNMGKLVWFNLNEVSI